MFPLKHGHYYAGKCRNAVVARWDAHTGLFYHWRDKFGRQFIETIDPWDPDGHYDGFLPAVDLGPTLPPEIPL